MCPSTAQSESSDYWFHHLRQGASRWRPSSVCGRSETRSLALCMACKISKGRASSSVHPGSFISNRKIENCMDTMPSVQQADVSQPKFRYLSF